MIPLLSGSSLGLYRCSENLPESNITEIYAGFARSMMLPNPILDEMSFDLTFFDLVLIILMAGCTVIGVRRGVAGLVVGIGVFPLWLVLNIIGGIHPLVGFLLSLAAGWLLGQLSKMLHTTGAISAASDTARAMMGGSGGVLLGMGLVAALALSFQTKATPVNGPGNFTYPSPDGMPKLISDSVHDSKILQWLSYRPSDGGLNIWNAAPVVRTLLVPDRNGSTQ
jgi:hypothetical protein